MRSDQKICIRATRAKGTPEMTQHVIHLRVKAQEKSIFQILASISAPSLRHKRSDSIEKVSRA